MKLNLGCGATTPVGWINVDYAFGARLARVPGFRWLRARTGLVNLDWDPSIVIADLRQLFPWPDRSADVIYSSHTFVASQPCGRRALSR
ncbi:MAG: hypothetical protein HC809_12105 [Gammaproteobacteria bacterium]|nr:hypothetical protein [Gammaproteobacteria bacterium]